MHKAKVCVVDDCVDEATLLCEGLWLNGYDALAVYNGVDAFERCGQGDIDLLLLDVGLPDIDGFGVCEILRSTEATATIPIVITSVWRSAGARRLGREFGAFDYLAKPFRADQLIDRVQRTLAAQAPTMAEKKDAKADASSAPKRRKVAV